MKENTATVLGGQGFIGRRLVSRLCALGWECRAPSRMEPFPQDDLGHVFYCAGLTADYAQRPFDTVEAHVCLLNDLLKHSRFDSLVYLSSTRLYDGQLAPEAVEDSILSLAPLNPRHIYDLSKALGESLCHVVGRGRARVARLSSVFDGQSDATGFLPDLIRRVIDATTGRGPSVIEVRSSPSFARDYVHIDDVLDALILIATRGTSAIYNVASGENISNEALFAALSVAASCQIVSLLGDIPSPLPRINIAKMRREFGWQPTTVINKLAAMIRENVNVDSGKL